MGFFDNIGPANKDADKPTISESGLFDNIGPKADKTDFFGAMDQRLKDTAHIAATRGWAELAFKLIKDGYGDLMKISDRTSNVLKAEIQNGIAGLQTSSIIPPSDPNGPAASFPFSPPPQNPIDVAVKAFNSPHLITGAETIKPITDAVANSIVNPITNGLENYVTGPIGAATGIDTPEKYATFLRNTIPQGIIQSGINKIAASAKQILNNPPLQIPIDKNIGSVVGQTTPLGPISEAAQGMVDYLRQNQQPEITRGALDLPKTAMTPEVLASGINTGISKMAELATDFYTDPVLLAINPAAKVLGSAAKYLKVKEAVLFAFKNAVKTIDPTGGITDWVLRTFTATGGKDPELVKLLNEFQLKEVQATDLSKEIFNSLTDGLKTHERLLIGDRLRGIIKSGASQLIPELEEKAVRAREIMTQLGLDATKAGLLKQKTFFENVGSYFPQLYRDTEYSRLSRKYGRFMESPNRVGESITRTTAPAMQGDRFRARKLTPEQFALNPQAIKEPAYPVALMIEQVSHDLNVHKLFKAIEKNPEWFSRTPKSGWLQASSSKAGTGSISDVKAFARPGAKWGILEGGYINPRIADDLRDVVHVPSQLGRMWMGFNRWYKMMKLFPNPASHFRNILGGYMVYDVSPSGEGLIKNLGALNKAVDEISAKGQYWKELKDAGKWRTDYATADLKLRMIDTLGVGGIMGAPMDSFLSELKRNGVKAAQDAASALGKLYSGPDNMFKLAHYMTARQRGMAIPEALAYMDKWGFDYTSISPFVRLMKNYVSPFFTYQAKALPAMAEAIRLNPAKFYKWPALLHAIDNMSISAHDLTPMDAEALRQRKSGKEVILPFSDSNGNPLVFDVTYILPWGDIQQGGGAFGFPPSWTISHPLISIPAQLVMNKNWFTNKDIYTDKNTDGSAKLLSGENWANTFDLIYKTLMPTVAPGSYSWDKVARSLSPVNEHRMDPRGNPYEFPRVMADVIFGLKTRSINVALLRGYIPSSLKRWLSESEMRIRKMAETRNLTNAEKLDKLDKEKLRIQNQLEDFIHDHEQETQP